VTRWISPSTISISRVSSLSASRSRLFLPSGAVDVPAEQREFVDSKHGQRPDTSAGLGPSRRGVSGCHRWMMFGR
jgi:hypothetical protein